LNRLDIEPTALERNTLINTIPM